VGWYQRVFVDTGRAPAVWMLIGFLVTFAVTRGITRRIHAKAAEESPRPGSQRGELSDIYIGGVLCGSGEIVVIENALGVRITDFRDDV